MICDISPLAMETIAQIHGESGFDYKLPDFGSQLFPIKRVATGQNGEIIAAAALKVEMEAYLYVNPEAGTPEERWEAIKELSADIEVQLRKTPIDSVYCVLPPEIAERFGKRLETLGWKLARPWPHYVFQLR